MCDTSERAIEIIPLAHKKMMQRGIAQSWIKEALMHPDQVVAGHGERWVAHRRMMMMDKERLLRVVFEETGNTLVVVTAYLTSDIGRYWRDSP